MITYIPLDIETIPTQRDDIRQYITSKVTHPANISKAETIAKWNEESRPTAEREAVEKTSFDGAFGQVVCVGLAVDDGEIKSVASLVERDVLNGLNAMLDEVPKKDWYSTCIIGHYVSGFDLLFLVQRFIVNGIRPHTIITRAAQAKPWESDKVFDTMVQWAGIKGSVSLDKLCIALGLPGKGDITGADVWPMVQAGRLSDVATYCEDDVAKVRHIFRRMTFAEIPAPLESRPIPVKQSIAAVKAEPVAVPELF